MRQRRHLEVDRQPERREEYALLQEPARPAFLPFLNHLPCANAVISAVIAVLTLIGWWQNIPFLQSVLPLSATMKVNTALGILACSASLFLRSVRRTQTMTAQRFAVGLAALAILIGLASLFEHATGRNLGINELLVKDTSARIAAVQPGLMSVNSATCLVSTGLALFCYRWRTRRTYLPMRIFATIPLLIALLAFTEHITGAGTMQGVANYTPMALHTTLCFLMLSLGLHFSHREGGLVKIVSSSTVGGALARRFLTAAVVLPLAVGTFISIGFHRGWYDWDLAAALFVTSFICFFVLLIWANVRELERIDLARRTVQETQAILDSILATAPIGFSFIDNRMRVRRVNAIMADALGITTDQALGQSLETIRHEFASRQAPMLRTVIATGEPVLNREECGPVSETSGDKRWWLSSYYPIRDARGHVLGVSSLHLDITEQRRSQEEREHLLQAEQMARRDVEAANTRLRALGDATNMLSSSLAYEATLCNVARSVVSSVGDYCIIDLLQNDGTTRRVGLAGSTPELDDVLKRTYRFPPDPNSNSPLARVLRTGVPALVESIPSSWLDAVARNGEHREVLKALRPHSAMIVPLEVRDRRVGIMNIVSTKLDRKYTQDDFVFAQELAHRAAIAIDNAQLYRQAQDAIRARDDMLAVVSHDLRNPLTAIDMSTSMILRRSPESSEGERLRRHAMTIQRSSRRMQYLIKDLLDASALESRTLSMERQAWSATTLLQEAADLAEPLTQGRGLDLVVEQEGLEGVVVDADRERVLQVLSNLLGNALKFTPEGGTIILRARREVHGVRIEVQDTGPGIQPDELPHLFDRYWKGQATGAKGTGLGLYIAQGVVRLHGSELDVDSQPGRGARFSFTLPFASEATQAPVFH